ncbi:hypothetical protein [Umezawaea tangerina]|uniref:Uncharacterized protein n=1 Tax=Umezawaea tangerina TaxID=84725 RepID=A0A2T0SPI4_9PSEU|nr:hypothetical protein [Umezawaea tangerina]PRY35318.1 hypothetical protein CLV43_114236 [Umezawaea tangerina]
MSHPDLPPLHLEAPEGHRWVRPASPPCPRCECCSEDLCELSNQRATLCRNVSDTGPDVDPRVASCPCTVYQPDEDTRVLLPPQLTECFNTGCERLMSLGTRYCCAPCRLVDEGTSEASGHSTACDARRDERHGHADVIGMTYVLVRHTPGSAVLDDLVRQLPAELDRYVDTRQHDDGTAVLAVRHSVLTTEHPSDETVTAAVTAHPEVDLVGLITGADLDARQPRR